ncbi:universal stress protein [Fictibacillus fluitans]|uniref:Universal stress protein n=1 Tax=Fictibacillus fluitans TaxID=3058422 RepID=A0ABT8HUT1_9BACL|nr:universal stress protein [Fictibacillus sp. NE201]MDN4524535.1 universal stress protein [Fictibacillus sp. NE201]
MYNKILIAFDGSPSSARALMHGVELAKTFESERVTIVHVNKNLPMQEPVMTINLDELIEEEDKELLLPAVKYLSDSGIHYETHTFQGDPGHVIASYANENGFDAIIIGSTGKGLIKEALLGSVSHSVAQLADCPVIIVK